MVKTKDKKPGFQLCQFLLFGPSSTAWYTTPSDRSVLPHLQDLLTELLTPAFQEQAIPLCCFPHRVQVLLAVLSHIHDGCHGQQQTPGLRTHGTEDTQERVKLVSNQIPPALPQAGVPEEGAATCCTLDGLRHHGLCL